MINHKKEELLLNFITFNKAVIYRNKVQIFFPMKYCKWKCRTHLHLFHSIDVPFSMLLHWKVYRFDYHVVLNISLSFVGIQATKITKNTFSPHLPDFSKPYVYMYLYPYLLKNFSRLYLQKLEFTSLFRFPPFLNPSMVYKIHGNSTRD